MRPQHRGEAQSESSGRVVDRWVERAKHGRGSLEAMVADTLWHERRRLDRYGGSPAEQAFYQKAQRGLRTAAEPDLLALLDDMARRFVAEIVGSFDERVYRVATHALPPALGLLLRATRPRDLFMPHRLGRGLKDHVEICGETARVRALLERGTLMVVPTHASHMDSLALGYAVYLLGIPPLLYGAGLNLFTNPLTSFFMDHLGAYRVDRKKTAPLYKEVLKEYATVALELGYHNLFFPGGTRSRSGAVERKLKKGLLGTALSAYVQNLRRRRPKPDVWIVPCTISHKLVLEAETLIDDHLKEVGKSRYIIEDDEFSKPRRVLAFLASLVRLDAKITITFSEPLDVVGNRVDANGRSLDPRGRVVDPKSYVEREGEPVHDEQRDHEYTSDLADSVGSAFARDNVVMSTHVVASVLHRMLLEKNRGMDPYRVLRTGGTTPSFAISDVAREVDTTLCRLREKGQAPRVADDIRSADAREVIDDALRCFGTYHAEPAARRDGERIVHENRNLLLFYGNRLSGYGTER